MSEDYQRIAAAIRYLEAHRRQQPSLEELAAEIGLSPFHFQKLFQRWAGVSPKRFLQHLTEQHARELLQASESVLATSFELGLSGSGRLHDLMVTVSATTPGEVKTGGAGLEIAWGVHDSPFGLMFLAVTPRGICRLEFPDSDQPEIPLQRLADDWPTAGIVENPKQTLPVAQNIFPATGLPNGRFNLLLRGTNFQLQVWRALLRIPEGRVVSYGQLAEAVGCPSAGRAVGSAVGKNPIAYLIPCHRVLRGDGGIGGYRWGTERKLALLGKEWLGSD